jgi:hypothetical protein
MKKILKKSEMKVLLSYLIPSDLLEMSTQFAEFVTIPCWTKTGNFVGSLLLEVTLNTVKIYPSSVVVECLLTL